MKDIKPGKISQCLVVKVRWVTHCPKCSHDVTSDCERRGMLSGPWDGREFYVPYYWLEAKCAHGMDSKIFESVYHSRGLGREIRKDAGKCVKGTSTP